MSAGAVVAWLATYAVHSTLLLGCAGLLARLVRTDTWRETLWKTALLGGIATATLPAAFGYTPLVGRWSVGAAEERAEPPAPAPGAHGGTGAESGSVPLDLPRDRDAETVGAAPTLLPAQAEARWSLVRPTLLVWLWAVVAALHLARLLFHHLRLRALLRDRRPVRQGQLPSMLAAIRRRVGFWTPVRLTVSGVCPTPIALGRAEICVPERFAAELDPEQQQAALAHELAHLQRRDPLWQLAAGVVESVFFFQPLNRLGRVRMRAAAENLCDDWAVRQTGSPLGLARCLTEVASWVGCAPIPERTLAMAEHGGPLLQRVERLIQWRDPSPGPLGTRLLSAAVLVAVVAATAPAATRTASAAVASPAAAEMEAVELPRTEEKGDPPAASAPDTVIRYPDPLQPLEERWTWALAQRFPRGFWVAWEVERPAAERRITSDRQPSAAATGARTVAEILGVEDRGGRRAVLVFGFAQAPARDGGVRWIRLRGRDDRLDLGGRPLVWLGTADPASSLARLRQLHAALAEPSLRSAVAAALSLHAAPREVVGAVEMLLREERSAPVRAEAVQWLARMHAREPAVVDLLARVAMADASAQVQQEAAEAIVAPSWSGAPGAAGNATEARVTLERALALAREREWQ